MFPNNLKRIWRCNYLNSRHFSIDYGDNSNIKVTICGAAGRIGQTVALFLKQSPLKLNLSLYDTSHDLMEFSRQLELINPANNVEAHVGPMKMRFALRDANIVTFLTKTKIKNCHGDSFDHNISTISSLAQACIEVCPNAILAIGTNPINSIVPAVNEIYKNHGIDNESKILGITALDSLLASAAYANTYSIESGDAFVPVTGGNTCDTIIPLFSQASPALDKPPEFEEASREKLYTNFFQYKSQDCRLNLVASFAITRFIQSVIKGLFGEYDIVECAFIASPNGAPVRYMSTLVDLGLNGVQNIYAPPSELSRYEEKVMNSALMNLDRDITLGERYAMNKRKTESRFR